MIFSCELKTPPKIEARFAVAKGEIQRITLAPAPHFTYLVDSSAPPSLKKEISEWIEGYLNGGNLSNVFSLDLSYLPPFSRRVLEIIGSVPFGQTISYGEVAKKAGSRGAARAIGNICHINPYPFVIPCHRIILSNGKIGGFAYSKQLKESLLGFEKSSLFFQR